MTQKIDLNIGEFYRYSHNETHNPLVKINVESNRKYYLQEGPPRFNQVELNYITAQKKLSPINEENLSPLEKQWVSQGGPTYSEFYPTQSREKRPAF
jgi:hypothetical protein